MTASSTAAGRPWAEEIPLPAAAARAAIEARFPDLAPARLEPLPAGWDHHIGRVNEAWVFRFPRRHIAVPLLEAERQVLPALADGLPLAVPSIERWSPPWGDIVTPSASPRRSARTVRPPARQGRRESSQARRAATSSALPANGGIATQIPGRPGACRESTVTNVPTLFSSQAATRERRPR